MAALLCSPVSLQAQVATDSTITERPGADTTVVNTNVAAAKPRIDTTRRTEDSMRAAIKKLPFEPKPKKAGMYSAICPGLGQIYNRQYWKAPVIYAGMAVAGYFFIDNLNKYQRYRKAYIARIDGDPTTTDTEQYDTDGLQQLQDGYRGYLDMTVLFTAVGYAAQVIDAVAAAHLKNFDVSRDISMRFRPVVDNNLVGFGLVMNFK